MEALGYLAAAAVGIALGILGGGGSILAVPILLYLFGLPTDTATGYSLFIVAVTAAVGAASLYRQGRIDLRSAAIFALPAFVSVALTRCFLLPALPDHLFQLGTVEITRNRATLLFFVALMVMTALSLLRRKAVPTQESVIPDTASGRSRTLRLFLAASAVGLITGLVGAGGGFLIVPTLVVFARLPMTRASGTSLFIIAMNSTVGFLSDHRVLAHADWSFLLGITTTALIGMALGVRIAPRIPENRLRPAFAVFLLIIAVYMTGHEFLSGPPALPRTTPGSGSVRVIAMP